MRLEEGFAAFSQKVDQVINHWAPAGAVDSGCGSIRESHGGRVTAPPALLLSGNDLE